MSFPQIIGLIVLVWSLACLGISLYAWLKDGRK